MQDRFRFRIWDKFCETWLTDFVINQDGEINKFFNSEEALKRRFVLMQCTGLKDKNGKLIYEGDILKLAEFGKPVEVKHRALGFVLRREPSNTVGYDNDKYIPEDCEVIGNIYENPELLEV